MWAIDFKIKWALKKTLISWFKSCQKILSFLSNSRLTKYIVVYTHLKALEKPCYNMWSINLKIKWALRKNLIS